MIIRDVKELIQNRERVSFDEIVFTLKTDKKIIEHALYLLKQKGIVGEERLDLYCRSCSCCGNCGGGERVFFYHRGLV